MAEGAPSVAPNVFTPMVAALHGVDISNGEVPLAPFLNAMKLLNNLFDFLGPKKFAAVKSDINGNINALERHAAANAAASNTFQTLLRAEMAAGKTRVKQSASISALWLKRGLQFMAAWMKNFSSTDMPMGVCAPIVRYY